MSRWTKFRDKITNFIDTNGSTVVITPKTLTRGTYGGYNPATDTTGTAVTTVGVSHTTLTNKNTEPFGKLKGGEATIWLKYSETVTKDYTITWQSDTYAIEEIKNIRAGNTLIAIRVELDRKLD